jgi:hypothetical protein
LAPFLAKHYRDKEVIVEDALDANQKKGGICGGIWKYIGIWVKGSLENETYRGRMEYDATYWKDVVEELDNAFPQTPRKWQHA